jgi:hypothetical protein
MQRNQINLTDHLGEQLGGVYNINTAKGLGITWDNVKQPGALQDSGRKSCRSS